MLAPHTIVGQYRVERLIGRGGMGEVYVASDESLGRDVALKLLDAGFGSDAESVARFRREGRMQAALDHPNVVTVFEAGESEHGLYLAMRLIDGPTLAALMVDGGVTAARAIGIFAQVASALDAAHAAGLVHRDVKPKNVLIEDGDHAWLTDFGLTRATDGDGPTMTGQIVGTPAYLAPEVIAGRPATAAADHYAFAAMLFECLSGGPVFPRDRHAATLHAHVSQPVPRISDRRAELPPALDDVFLRALAKDPVLRPRTAVELVDSVRAALEDAGLAALGPPAPLEPLPSPPSTVDQARRGWPLVASRGGRRTAIVVTLAWAASLVAVTVLASSGGTSAAAPALAPLAGSRGLGSDLAAPGRLRDCRGRPVTPASPDCTIRQTGLAGATLVVPKDGVIRRWAVRSARGELALAVLREREGRFFQVNVSRNEFVNDGSPHAFATDIPVERGDVIGLHVLAGSGVGARAGAAGAATNRWLPRLGGRRPPEFTSGTGFDDELLVHADYLPGGQQHLPAQVTGAAAAALPAGRVRRRTRLRFADGHPLEVDLVALPGHFALDLWRRQRRAARIDVPGARPEQGQVLAFDVVSEPSESELALVTFRFAINESARIITHFYVVFAREFEYTN